MAKQDDWVRLTVRMPPELYERLADTVARGPLSMNAEIVDRLENSFASDHAVNQNQFERSAKQIAYEAATEAAKLTIENYINSLDSQHNRDFEVLSRLMARQIREEILSERKKDAHGQTEEGDMTHLERMRAVRMLKERRAKLFK